MSLLLELHQYHLAPMYCRQKIILLLVLIVNFTFIIGAAGKVPPIVVKLFRLSGRSNSPVVPAFRSFQLSSRSSFPVVPTLQSFQLPVVPTLRSFQLSGRSGFPVFSVISALWSYWSLLSFQVNPI